MKKLSSITILSVVALIFSLIALPASTVFAAYADGTYEVNYEIKEAGNDNTSIADGYFTKPATLTIKDGVQTIQLTVTSATMIESLSVQGSPVEVVSDNGDTRVVKFNVSGDMSQPVNMKMHVIVPEEALPGGYDMEHGARAVFDVSGIPAKGSADNGEESTTENSSDDGVTGPVDNPQTSDKTPIAMYITLLVGSIAVFAVYKFRFARN